MSFLYIGNSIKVISGWKICFEIFSLKSVNKESVDVFISWTAKIDFFIVLNCFLVCSDEWWTRANILVCSFSYFSNLFFCSLINDVKIRFKFEIVASSK